MKMKIRDSNNMRSEAGWTIFDLLVFILAAVPATYIGKLFGETKPGLFFFLSYAPLGFLLWGLTFVWIPRLFLRIRQSREQRTRRENEARRQ